MPDFTIEMIEECSSGRINNLGGYLQRGLRSENPNCTCEAFKYRKRCKHINEAIRDMCPYYKIVDNDDELKEKCPLCGEKTQYTKVAC